MGTMARACYTDIEFVQWVSMIDSYRERRCSFKYIFDTYEYGAQISNKLITSLVRCTVTLFMLEKCLDTIFEETRL